ncbi:hypothetical protein [Anaplasma capra]|uniref:hypothetical protein n=1 Tax=Anaplasma capra TaxID=1562740 RepID=UPI0021D5F335|nr:hypothetical protein [Anaplasma capra]
MARRLLRSIRKKRSLDSSSVFLAASFVIILTEVFCSSFTLYCLKNGVSSGIKAKVTVAYYCLYAALSFILAINSALSLMAIRKEYKTNRNEKTRKQFVLEATGETLTMVSGLMWFTISTSSVIMVFAAAESMRSFLMFLSIAAPLLGALSSFLRAYETYLTYKKVNRLAASGDGASDTAASRSLQSKRAWYFVQAGLYACIALFEFSHFSCHVWEACILQGNTHLIFNIQEVVLLGIQVFLATTFVFLEIAKTFLDRKLGAQLAQDITGTPETCASIQEGSGAESSNDNNPEIGERGRAGSGEQRSCPVGCVSTTQVVLAADPQLSH